MFTRASSSRPQAAASPSTNKKALVRAATLTGAAQEKLATVNQGYAYYKPLPLQNQGGNHHEATDQLQSSRRLPD